MYSWTGAPWKTSAVLRAARTLFTDTPYGMPGNDDLGTISAWLVFGMTGVFEAQPGSGTYPLSTPMIETPRASAAKLQYTKDVQVGPRGYDRSWISHADLLRAGKIRFRLSDTPTSWGTKSAPPAM